MSRPTVIGLLHPGEMGCAIGAELVGAGHRVLWASGERGQDTTDRARAAGLEDVRTARAIAESSDVIVSVCPPAAVLEVAGSVAGFAGIYVDANAVAPRTARLLCDLVTAGGASFVDGGIIGRPPRASGDVRLYLSGGRADEVSALFDSTVISTPVLGTEPGAASAIKLAYAGWTKGSMALLLSTTRFAGMAGVEEALRREWAQSQPDLSDQWNAAERAATAKGWRWVAEMKEIAAAMEDESLPSGYHEAAALTFDLPRP